MLSPFSKNSLILVNLLENLTLTTENFAGEDALSVKKYDDDKLNANEMLDDYVKVMRSVYHKVKEIYMEKQTFDPVTSKERIS